MTLRIYLSTICLVLYLLFGGILFSSAQDNLDNLPLAFSEIDPASVTHATEAEPWVNQKRDIQFNPDVMDGNNFKLNMFPNHDYIFKSETKKSRMTSETHPTIIIFGYLFDSDDVPVGDGRLISIYRDKRFLYTGSFSLYDGTSIEIESNYSHDGLYLIQYNEGMSVPFTETDPTIVDSNVTNPSPDPETCTDESGVLIPCPQN